MDRAATVCNSSGVVAHVHADDPTCSPSSITRSGDLEPLSCRVPPGRGTLSVTVACRNVAATLCGGWHDFEWCRVCVAT